MVAALDITGERFGKLVAMLRCGTNSRGRAIWRFLCDCGHVTERDICSARVSANASCGCHKAGWGNKGRHPASRTHGLSKTRTYRVWSNMRSRCNDPTNQRYADYGGRGITVCDAWQKSAPFLEWALANGYSDGLQLDRIDNDGPYSPDNCRFVTPAENMAGRRNSVKFVIFGEEMGLGEAERRFGIKGQTLKHRILLMGMTPEDAATTPKMKKGDRARLGV